MNKGFVSWFYVPYSLFLLPLQRRCLGTRARGFLRVISALSALWCPHLSVWTRQRQLWGRRVGKSSWLERSLIRVILGLSTVFRHKKFTFVCRSQGKHSSAKSHPWAAQDSLIHKWTGPSARSALLVPHGETLRATCFPVYLAPGWGWPQAPGSALSHPSILSKMCSERFLGRSQQGPELQQTSQEWFWVFHVSHNPPLALPVGSGASFCVLHADPMEPIGTAPLSDPTVRNGSARSVRLLPKS